ncbi:MAG TPA: radical SAM protein [Proteobacteria bacterium]|nr:radical SAM protein [Pseudomonadota bacterium]
MHYEGIIIRPPSEAYSILLQITVGCSHNKCTFCGAYKEKRFRIKDETTILNDLSFAARHFRDQNRVFLLDGDALIMPFGKLAWVLRKIKEHLPWVSRVGIYANTRGIKSKTLEELVTLRQLGLGIIYLGVESGDNVILKNINKGTNAETLIQSGPKIRRAGIKLSVTVLLGIAGEARSLTHARKTGEVLTAMRPNHVGALTLMVLDGTPLGEDFQAGRFKMPPPKELLVELREMLLNTHLCPGLFFSNHASNYLPLRVRLPKDKAHAISLIDSALKGEIALKPETLRAL